jgi:hypothetical protein
MDYRQQVCVITPREHIDAMTALGQHACDVVDVDVLATGIDTASGGQG